MPSTAEIKRALQEGRSFLSLIESTQVPESLETRMERAWEQLSAVFKQILPDCEVGLCGSVVQGVHDKSSDVDMWFHDPASTPLHEVAGKLELFRAQQDSDGGAILRIVETIEAARVPFIKVEYGGVKVDLSQGRLNPSGVPKGCNDRLLRALFEGDPRTRNLVRFTKCWAKAQHLVGAAENYLNSMGWALLVIVFCSTQKRKGFNVDLKHLPVECLDDDLLKVGAMPPRLHPLFRQEDAPTLADFRDFLQWMGVLEDDCRASSTLGLSLVDGKVVEIVGARGPFFIEEPGTRLASQNSGDRRPTKHNLASALGTHEWFKTLRCCREAFNVLKDYNTDADRRPARGRTGALAGSGGRYVPPRGSAVVFSREGEGAVTSPGSAASRCAPHPLPDGPPPIVQPQGPIWQPTWGPIRQPTGQTSMMIVPVMMMPTAMLMPMGQTAMMMPMGQPAMMMPMGPLHRPMCTMQAARTPETATSIPKSTEGPEVMSVPSTSAPPSEAEYTSDGTSST